MKINSTISDKKYNDNDQPALMFIVVDTTIDREDGRATIYLNTIITPDDCDISDNDAVSTYMEGIVNQALSEQVDDPIPPPPFIPEPLDLNMGNIFIPILIIGILLSGIFWYQHNGKPIMTCIESQYKK